MDGLKNIWEMITRFWSDRSMAQRVLMGGLAASLMVAFAFMLYWLNKPEFRVLYSKLSQEDAARVLDQLRAAKIPFKIEDNGTAIMVPADNVHELRLKIAGEGSLHGSGIGFEIFDETKVGQTDFVQRLNYQRALQGELARTIMEFPEVEKARVHLVLPHKSLFIEEQKKASVSVVLTYRQGQKLEQKQIQGIVNLVTMAVEGLDPSKVTITDTSGKMLYQPKSDNPIDGMSTTQLEFKRGMEQSLEARIEQMLTPIIGPGKAIARVSADLDFAQRTLRRESFDPEKTVIRSQQRSEETSQGRASVDQANVPDQNFRGDGFSGTATTQNQSRENRTTNFEINKEEENIVAPMGDVKRLSVSVIVDGSYEKGANGESRFVPRDAAELERIKTAVSTAVGVNAQRGDVIEVSSFSFGGPDPYAEPSLVQTMMEYAQRLGKPFINAILVFLFLILVVRPVVMALIRPRVSQEEIETLERLPEAERRIALTEVDEEEEIAMLEPSKRLENAKVMAQQFFESNTEQAITFIRGWLKQEAA